MKKLAVFILAFCLLSGTAVRAERAVTVSSECSIEDINEPLEASAPSAAIGQKLEIKAKSVILMEPVTGKVLYEDNQDEKTPPASITKIMSLLLVMEAIDSKDISLETVVTASEHACSMGGSQIWLEPGETMTVNDLLKATVIASANDACVALGELVAGSEEGFVAMMNRRAKELGMTSTNFVNCTGLDADGHLTTAYDVALMSSELIKHPLIKDYSTVWMDSLRDGKSELVNTNKLVRFYEGTTGLKTGTTSTAKYCLSATAQRNGLELVAVIMSADSTADRFNGAKKLLDYGFANYNFSSVNAGLDENTAVKVEKGTQREVKVKALNDLSVLMPKSASGNIERKVSLNE
ncbi:MAG: D-alanyl-D-alanine carboxypeptidase family protein, partial [Acutalibacteraceae bacterium]|nr:D-alanyl-D-alanine carboxypeptidase family protein [Acutalibacteraceae bacterium]